jgi:hypothetical protein
VAAFPKERREIEPRHAPTTSCPRSRGRVPDGPDIAYAHHEKLDGTGYPRRLKASEIPIQSKMMTISDIFDALVAWDRPYKKSVPIERADILKDKPPTTSWTATCCGCSSVRSTSTLPKAGAEAELLR